MIKISNINNENRIISPMIHFLLSYMIYLLIVRSDYHNPTIFGEGQLHASTSHYIAETGEKILNL